MNKNKGSSFIYLLDLDKGMSRIKIKASFVLSLILFLTISGASFPSSAQVSGNVRITEQTAGSNNNNSGTPQTFLTDRTVELNSTGSCDSTCDAMGSTAPASTMQSAFMTRVQACDAGYTGSKTQTRTQNPDGTFTAWVDADTSHCVCAPTYQDSTQACALPQAGTFVRRTPWVCTGNVGSFGAPTTITNNCFTPCALPSPSTQSSTLACTAGQAGTYTQARTASCPSGIGSNSSSVWSGWTTTSNNCYTPCVVPATQYTSSACPAGYTGSYYYYNAGVCPGGAGANSTPYYSGWVNYSNNCAVRRYAGSEFSGAYSGPHSEGQTGFQAIYNGTGVGFTLDANPYGGYGPYYFSNAEGSAPQTSSTSGAPYGDNRQYWAPGTWMSWPAGQPQTSYITLPNGQVLSTSNSYSFSITP